MKAFVKNALTLLLMVASGALLFAQSNAQQASGTSSSQAAQPAAKHVPQAKTQAEFKDYNAAYAVNGGAASEKAAEDFSAKYPASELKTFLYSKAMHEYQTENNKPKILEMGTRVLQYDPDNPVALVLTATVMADMLENSDPDLQKKAATIKTNGTHALETINADFALATNASPEQVTAYKKILISMAHSALGIAALKTNDDAGAEKELKAAADANPSQPDAYVWYHLALAQDHQQKYAEALTSVNQAVQYASADPDLAGLAKGERERLQTLTGSTGSNDAKQAPK